jgi:hypothetical protein
LDTLQALAQALVVLGLGAWGSLMAHYDDPSMQLKW